MENARERMEGKKKEEKENKKERSAPVCKSKATQKDGSRSPPSRCGGQRRLKALRTRSLVPGSAAAAARAGVGWEGPVAGWPVQPSRMACRGKGEVTGGLAGATEPHCVGGTGKRGAGL